MLLQSFDGFMKDWFLLSLEPANNYIVLVYAINGKVLY
jgi:hypothetical protein